MQPLALPRMWGVVSSHNPWQRREMAISTNNGLHE